MSADPGGSAMPEPVQLVLDRLEGVRRSGGGWMARCPAHADRHASLALAAGDDGRALLTCHAGCATETVVAVLGLEMADLYPRTNGASGPARPGPAQVRRRETRYRVQLADGSQASESIEHVRLDLADALRAMGIPSVGTVTGAAASPERVSSWTPSLRPSYGALSATSSRITCPRVPSTASSWRRRRSGRFSATIVSTMGGQAA